MVFRRSRSFQVGAIAFRTSHVPPDVVTLYVMGYHGSAQARMRRLDRDGGQQRRTQTAMPMYRNGLERNQE